MNIKYCQEKCEKGYEVIQKVIWDSESVFDAIVDFDCFVKECFKTCPYKEFHKEEKSDD